MNTQTRESIWLPTSVLAAVMLGLGGLFFVQISTLNDNMNSRFSSINDNMNSHVSSINSQLSTLNANLTAYQTQTQNEFIMIRQELQAIRDDISRLDKDFETLAQQQ